MSVATLDIQIKILENLNFKLSPIIKQNIKLLNLINFLNCISKVLCYLVVCTNRYIIILFYST